MLDEKRFKFANQAGPMPAAERQKHARAFLLKGFQKLNPTSSEFCAYGQACIEMARGVFKLLHDHKAVLFASMIPRGTGKATTSAELLRKDHILLLERFFYFLEKEEEYGLLVMDGSEKTIERKLVRQLEEYFTETQNGRQLAKWIVPTPYFVSSDMAYAIQVADLCIYCLNWEFRLPTKGMIEPIRETIKEEFSDWIQTLQFKGEKNIDGVVFKLWGIFYVRNPN